MRDQPTHEANLNNHPYDTEKLMSGQKAAKKPIAQKPKNIQEWIKPQRVRIRQTENNTERAETRKTGSRRVTKAAEASRAESHHQTNRDTDLLVALSTVKQLQDQVPQALPELPRIRHPDAEQ